MSAPPRAASRPWRRAAALGRELSVIGRSIDRRDALEKVTGPAMYSSDMTLPGMLHAKILRCPHAHARIRRIDTRRAAALPGVRAVLGAENTPRAGTPTGT